jgi:hypothetical protein
MILRQSLKMRRLVTSRLKSSQTPRLYHASVKLNADALDMADTFARRHSEFLSWQYLLSTNQCVQSVGKSMGSRCRFSASLGPIEVLLMNSSDLTF